MGTGPLDGIKVVDVSSAVAGAWVSSQLAEMGADVVLIEKVGASDVMRLTGAIVGDQSGCWVQMHRNKRGMDLDIRDERGREILLQLVEGADVFIQNFRPGVAERLRIGYDDLSRRVRPSTRCGRTAISCTCRCRASAPTGPMPTSRCTTPSSSR